MDQLGDYRLLEELATGATGRVYAASRWPALSGHNLLAVKRMDLDLSRNERFVMLVREGAAHFSEFEHPGAVPVLEVTTVGGQLLVVSQLVDGQPLDRVLRHWTEQKADIDPILSLWITHRIASVLAAAQGAGLVHGHLAPDQILLTYEGEVRLIGLGRSEARGVLPLNERRRSFLAPEVLRTGVATAASDVHGLARVMHHTLSGVHSVLSNPGQNAPAWLPPLRSYGVVIHPALETMVAGMLAASPNARPSLDDVESALKSAVGARGPDMRTRLARLMQTAFTTEVAAARLRRRRVNRGPDEAASRDDYFVPKLPRRALSAGDDTLPPVRRSRDLESPVDHVSSGPPERVNGRLEPSPGRSPTAYDWNAHAPLDDDPTPSEIYNSVMQHGAAQAGAAPRSAPPGAVARGATAPRAAVPGSATPPRTAAPPRPSDVVEAGDPRLKALESGDDEALMALVDAIVSHSTPPQGVRAEPEVSDPLDTAKTAPMTAREVRPSPAEEPPAPRLLDDHPANVPANQRGPQPNPPQSLPRNLPYGLADTGGMVYPVEDYGVRPLGNTEVLEPREPSLEASLDRELGSAPSPIRSVALATRAPEPEVDDDGAVFGDDDAETDGLPLPEPLPPEAIFGDEVPRLPSGTIIGERYKIEEVIGEGGVSVVYRCSQIFLRKDVAIKVLRPELATMPPVVERFHREARSVAQLDHTNIVRVIDFGKSSAGSLFLVMDLIDGISLADEIDREGYLAPTSAVRIVISILTGLEHAHNRGVIHRDLKPDNIMLVARDSGPTDVKILDFGIAKLGDVEIGSRPITEAGMVFGTPRYMSPEQAAGEPVDHRSDLFAVGIILYQLLSGQLPFDGETTVQILRRVLTQPAPRLKVNGLPGATSEALADVIALALAKNPEERYPSARTMREALQACFPL